MLKILRVHWGNYVADPAKIIQLKYKQVKHTLPILSIQSENQGFAQIKGTTKKVGANYSPVPVCVFRRDNRQLLWEVKSKADGSYAFRNIAVGLECFIVALDPNNQYNAVIQDKVIAK